MTDTKTQIAELEALLEVRELLAEAFPTWGRARFFLQSLKDKDAEIERRILERLPMRLRVEVKHVLDGTKPEILRND